MLLAGALAALLGWTQFDDPARGLSVAYPADWHRATSSLTPDLADPREILSVGTGRMAPHGEGCAQMPVGALRALRAADVLVTVFERARPGGGYPPRRPLRLRGRGDLTDASVCAGRRGLRTWWRPFRDGRRAFYVLVAAGDRTSQRRLHEAERVADGLRFTQAG